MFVKPFISTIKDILVGILYKTQEVLSGTFWNLNKWESIDYFLKRKTDEF